MAEPVRWRPARPILLLLSAQLISVVGTQITDLALPSLAVLRLHAGPAFTSALLTAGYLPAALAGPALGALVDRVSLRAVMVGADLVRAATLVSVPLAAATGHLSLAALLVVVALVGVASAPFDSATFAALPRIVASQRLARVNAVFAGGGAVGRIGGPGLAGTLIGLVGAATAIVADVASYVISAAMLMFLRVPAPTDPPVPRTGTRIRGSWRTDVAAGIAQVRTDPVVGRGILGITLLNLGGSGIGGLITLYAYRRLGFSPQQLGLTMAIGSVGVLIGAFAAPRLGRRWGTGNILFALASVAAGSLLLIPLASRGAGFVLLAMYEAVFGFAAAAWSVLLTTAMQQRTPAEMLGRVSALSQSLGVSAVPIGTAIAALTAPTLGLVPALLILCAAAIAAPVLYASSRFRHQAGTRPDELGPAEHDEARARAADGPAEMGPDRTGPDGARSVADHAVQPQE